MKKKKILLQLRKQKISSLVQQNLVGGTNDTTEHPYCVSKKTECEDGCFDTFKEDGCYVVPIDIPIRNA